MQASQIANGADCRPIRMRGVDRNGAISIQAISRQHHYLMAPTLLLDGNRLLQRNQNVLNQVAVDNLFTGRLKLGKLFGERFAR